MFKKIMLIVCCLALFVGILSCGANGDYSNDRGYYTEEEDTYEGNEDSTDENSLLIQDTTRKIYYKSTLNITSTDVQKDAKTMNGLVSQYNGYIETCQSSADDEGNLYRVYYVYRIPSDKLATFKDNVEDEGFIVTKNDTVSEDITNTYNQTEATIETLTTTRALYVKMLEDATTTDEIIKFNEKIAEIDVQLATYTKNKNTYDELLNYSTVYVTITKKTEKTVVEDPTFFEEYGEYLVQLGTILFEIFMYLLPFAAVAGIVLAIIFVPKAIKKHKKQEQINNNKTDL